MNQLLAALSVFVFLALMRSDQGIAQLLYQNCTRQANMTALADYLAKADLFRSFVFVLDCETT